MRKNITKLIASMLAIIMLVAMLATTAFASETNVTVYQAPSALEFDDLDYTVTWDYANGQTQTTALEELGIRTVNFNGTDYPAYSIEPEQTAIHYGSFGNHNYQVMPATSYAKLSADQMDAILLAIYSGYTNDGIMRMTRKTADPVEPEDPTKPDQPAGSYVSVNYWAVIPTITWTELYPSEVGLHIPMTAANRDDFQVLGMQGVDDNGELFLDCSAFVSECIDIDNDGFIDVIRFDQPLRHSSIDYWTIVYYVEEPTEPIVITTTNSVVYTAEYPTMSWDKLYLARAGLQVPYSAYESGNMRVLGMQGEIGAGEIWNDYTAFATAYDNENDGFINNIVFDYVIMDSSIDYWVIEYTVETIVDPSGTPVPTRHPTADGEWPFVESVFTKCATQAVIYEIIFGKRASTAGEYYLCSDNSFINAVGKQNLIGDAYAAINANMTTNDPAAAAKNVRALADLRDKLYVLVPAETDQPTLCFVAADTVNTDNATEWADVGATLVDIPSNNTAILNSIYRGYMIGTSSTTWSPDTILTRAQFVTLLYRIAGSPDVEAETQPFADVALGTWYTEPVIWAYANGITAGTSATTFSPYAKLTRAQVMTFLYRFYEMRVAEYGAQAMTRQIPATIGSYDACIDTASVPKWARTAYRWAYDNGISIPAVNGRLMPTRACARADIAFVITNLTSAYSPETLVQ